MDIHQIDGVGPNVSLKDTWTKMKENNIKTLPILRDEELLGVISTGDIATSYMDVYDNMILSKARTQYRNIMNTLDGEMVTGNEHGYFTKGKVAIGASSPELMQEFIEKDDLVILGNRVESQMCALDIDVSCMVVCQNAEVSEEVIRRRFLNVSKKKVILVDHNEKNQAVDGIEEAEIVEIIDHHRLGNIETMGPVFFRNQPVGCTATIVYQMYKENDVEITPTIAGLLCSAIISDTLLFRSPTCTSLDEKVAKKLGKIAGINLEEQAQAMFKAGSSLAGKTAEDICFQDFKQFTVNDMVFGVGQLNSMSKEELQEVKEMLTPYLPEVLEKNGVQMVFFMLTDILDESTELLCCGAKAKEYIIDAFDLKEDSEKMILKGVVSRKKQLIPTLVSELQQ